MVKVNQSSGSVTQGGPDTGALQLVSNDQHIPFSQYIRHVLPLDGYIYWLKTQTTKVRGSLHVSVVKQQNVDETVAVNRVQFSTADPVQQFNDISPDMIWVGEYGGAKFAFTQTDGFFQAADLYHYSGTAVYPALANLLVDVGQQLTDATLIVSNSLPIWLSLKTYTRIWLAPLNPGITLYPAFAVPDNIRPPYGVVHIDPNQTIALQMAPYFNNRASHWQLTQDQVTVTLYGATNDMALDFVDLVMQFTEYEKGVLGVTNMPVVRDEKRTQPELGILAMKKTVLFTVNYYQQRVNDIARQLIKNCIVSFYERDTP